MKKILTIAAIVALGTVASYSQGLVSIALAGGNLVTTNNGSVSGRIQGAGAYDFVLLVGANSTVPGSASNLLDSANLSFWTDTGVTGTSQSSLNAGKISALGSASATGWPAPGASYDNARSYLIVGWSTAQYGTTWANVANLIQQPSGLAAGGYFGFTAVSLNYAGGGTSGLPTVNLWGNQTATSGFGVNQGLVLNQVTAVPEPSTLVLAGSAIGSV